MPPPKSKSPAPQLSIQLLGEIEHHPTRAWKHRMEIYDIVMIVVVIGATIFGAVKGFAWQLASIASIVISYTVAYKYREPFSQSIQADPPWNRFLAMLILFIGTSLLIWVVFRMVSGTIDRLKLREFDRQVGAMFGLAKGALYCILITLFAVTLAGDSVREKIVRSKSGNYIANILDRSEAVIPVEIQDVVGPYLERFDQEFHHPEQTGGSLQSPWVSEAQSAAASTAAWGREITNGNSPGFAQPSSGYPNSNGNPNSSAWSNGQRGNQPASSQASGYPPGAYQQGFNTGGATGQGASTFAPSTPAGAPPQQARQPIWNGFQR